MPKALIDGDGITITELIKALAWMAGHEPAVVNNNLQAMEIANTFKRTWSRLI